MKILLFILGIPTIILVSFIMTMLIIVVTVPISSLLNIFVPGYDKRHKEHCLLKHETIEDRFWHFLDTRANIITFDHHGCIPLKKSPNRKGYLIRNIDFNKEMIETGAWGGPEYIQYCKDEIAKSEKELTNLP